MGNNCCTWVNRKDIAKKKHDVDFTTQKLQIDTPEGNEQDYQEDNRDFDNKYVEVSPTLPPNPYDEKYICFLWNTVFS